MSVTWIGLKSSADADVCFTMRFAAACAALVALTISSDAFQLNQSMPKLERQMIWMLQATVTDGRRQPSKRDERLGMMRSKQFHRNGFKEVRRKVEEDMKHQYRGSAVQELRDSDNTMERNGVRVFLAKVRR